MNQLNAAGLLLAAVAGTAPAPVAAAQNLAASASGTRTAYEPSFFAAGRPDTAYDMILLLPAFTFDPGGGARGYEASAGNVLIDGQRPAAKFDTLTDLLKRIPASSVAKIEVIRGGASGIDMLGRTVVANIIRAPTVTSVVLQADALLNKKGGIGPSFQLQASRRKGKSSLEASINIYKHEGASTGTASKVRHTNAGTLVSSANVEFTNPLQAIKANGHAELPAWKGLLRLNASAVIGSNTVVELDHTSDAGGLHADLFRSQFSTKQGELSGDFKRSLGENLELNIVALQNIEKSRNADSALQPGTRTEAREDDLAGETILRTELSWPVSQKLSAQFSAEGAYNFLGGTSLLSVNRVDVPLPSADVHVAEARAEFAGQASWKLSPKLLVEAGSKIELSRLTVSGDEQNAVSLIFPKPRLFVVWSPTENNQVRLRMERTVSQLDFGQFVSSSSLEQGVINAGNAELVPERDWVSEAAFEHRLLGDGAIVLTLSHFLLSDVIDEVPVDGFSAPGNIGDGTRDQAEINLNLPLDKLGLSHGRLTADGTWRHSRVTDPTTGERRRISNEQRFSGVLSLTQDIPSLRSTWHVDATSANRYDIFRIDEIQRFHVGASVNVSWEYRPKPNLSLLAQVQNITNNISERERLIFDGLRGDGSPAFIDVRDVKSGPAFYVRIRRTF